MKNWIILRIFLLTGIIVSEFQYRHSIHLKTQTVYQQLYVNHNADIKYYSERKGKTQRIG